MPWLYRLPCHISGNSTRRLGRSAHHADVCDGLVEVNGPAAHRLRVRLRSSSFYHPLKRAPFVDAPRRTLLDPGLAQSSSGGATLLNRIGEAIDIRVGAPRSIEPTVCATACSTSLVLRSVLPLPPTRAIRASGIERGRPAVRMAPGLNRMTTPTLPADPVATRPVPSPPTRSAVSRRSRSRRPCRPAALSLCARQT